MRFFFGCCWKFFGLVVGVFGGFCTTFWVVWALRFWVWVVFWFALGCGCWVIYVGFNWGSMLGKLWVLVGWEVGAGFLVAALICKFFL